MVPKPTKDIVAADILSLIDNKVLESRSIEYKEALPGNSDGEKKEFLKDVSSFANGIGGDILYGVQASEGIPVEAIGIPGNIDDAKLRLEQILCDGLDPRIQGLTITPIPGFPKGPVLLIRIPNSWAAPHMVKFGSSSLFFARAGSRKHPMDVREIRSSFLKSQEIPDRMKAFRDGRLGKILSGDTLIPLREGPKVVLHLLPFSSFSTDSVISPLVLEKEWSKVQLLGALGADYRFNLEGVLTYNEDSYCQLFRNGCIESFGYLNTFKPEGYDALFLSSSYEINLLNAVVTYLETMTRLEITCPVYGFITLLGVKSFCLFTPNFRLSRSYPADRETVISPEVEIREFPDEEKFQTIASVFRPSFDTLWNAFGYACCRNFDRDGKWKA